MLKLVYAVIILAAWPHIMLYFWDTVITVPVKTVQVITVLGKNDPGKKGPAYNQHTNEQFCCLLRLLENH